MIIEQLYTKCLSQGAYYIESNGEAAVIDPLRDVDTYLALASEHNARIVYVFETHFHADFVSGHLDLAAKTHATIVYGPTAEPGFPALVARDGEVFTLGHLTITVLHTPGHTPESACFLLADNNGKPLALFTGDTLFIGDVGRPDLAQSATGLTSEALAGMLYDSIQTKILTLPGEVVLYPGHGAGSACGKNMSNETTDTLAHQRASNYALRPGITREQFIEEVLRGLTPPPGYFAADARLNKLGYTSIDEVVRKAMNPFTPQELDTRMQQANTLLLDTRCPEEFCAAHIPGSANIGLRGQFAFWAGTLFPDLHRPIILVCDAGTEKEAVTRLARVGFDNVTGYLDQGLSAWLGEKRTVRSITSIDAATLSEKITAGCQLLDVRDKSEYDALHVPDAVNLPLSQFRNTENRLDPRQLYYVYCGSGYRSVTFISLLYTQGFSQMVNITGGMNAIKPIIELEAETPAC